MSFKAVADDLIRSLIPFSSYRLGNFRKSIRYDQVQYFLDSDGRINKSKLKWLGKSLTQRIEDGEVAFNDFEKDIRELEQRRNIELL